LNAGTDLTLLIGDDRAPPKSFGKIRRLELAAGETNVWSAAAGQAAFCGAEGVLSTCLARDMFGSDTNVSAISISCGEATRRRLPLAPSGESEAMSFHELSKLGSDLMGRIAEGCAAPSSSPRSAASVT
jgi:hypothetical protein